MINIQHVKTLKELNIEYLALEQQAFVLDMPDSFYTLYNPTLNHTLDQELTQMAKKMVSIVSSLGEYPSIRYYAQSTAPSPPSKLANLLQIEVDKFCENDESVSKVGNQLIFMIVERSVDVLTPLLHEFTYQAMMHDLLSFSDHGKYQYDCIFHVWFILNKE